MPKLVWDKVGEHYYETGAKNGVLYPITVEGNGYDAGVVWNGLTSVNITPDGGDPNPIYADDIKYLDLYGAVNINGTINTYMFPDEFATCLGYAQVSPGLNLSSQPRTRFGFSFRSSIGNDTKMDKFAYKLHMVFNAMATPPEFTYNTRNDSPEAEEMSFEFNTTPVEVGGTYDPMAYMYCESHKADAAKLAELETDLYGGTGQNDIATLPSPADIIAIFAQG